MDDSCVINTFMLDNTKYNLYIKILDQKTLLAK